MYSVRILDANLKVLSYLSSMFHPQSQCGHKLEHHTMAGLVCDTVHHAQTQATAVLSRPHCGVTYRAWSHNIIFWEAELDHFKEGDQSVP